MKTNNESKKLVSLINTWFKIYLPVTKGYSSQTIASYKTAVNLFLDYLDFAKTDFKGRLRYDDFSRENVENWLVWLVQERSNSKSSRNQRLAVMKSLIKYLSSKDHSLDSSYLEIIDIKQASHSRGKIVEGLTKDAFKIFMESIDCHTKTGKRDFALFTFMYDTGCRVGEVLNLKVKDLKLDEKSPYVIVNGKGSKLRTLVLSERNVNTLKLYLRLFLGEKPNKESYIFYSSHGGTNVPLNEDSVNQRLHMIAKIAHERCSDVPLNMHSHVIRHTAASHWFNEDGINLAKISAYLGHNSLDVTRIYIGISKDELVQAMMKRSNIPNEEPKYKGLKHGLRDLIE